MKIDEEWKKKVKERDNYTCQICKKQLEGRNCHAHHILPKGIKEYRWDINNGITLCYRCHKVGNYSAHMNAIWFSRWLETMRPAQYEYLLDET